MISSFLRSVASHIVQFTSSLSFAIPTSLRNHASGLCPLIRFRSGSARCGKAISGYDHFNSGACVLFEAAEIDAWNRMMAGVNAPRNEARDRVDAQIQMYPNRVRACPACRQPNVKVRKPCPRGALWFVPSLFIVESLL